MLIAFTLGFYIVELCNRAATMDMIGIRRPSLALFKSNMHRKEVQVVCPFIQNGQNIQILELVHVNGSDVHGSCFCFQEWCKQRNMKLCYPKHLRDSLTTTALAPHGLLRLY